MKKYLPYGHGPDAGSFDGRKLKLTCPHVNVNSLVHKLNATKNTVLTTASLQGMVQVFREVRNVDENLC